MDLMLEIDVLPPIKQINKPVYKKIVITDNCACGQKMRSIKDNGVRKYICDSCGRFINTMEPFENKIEVPELERTKLVYGNKSGAKYMRKIKEDIMTELHKVTIKFNITQDQVYSIVEKFLAIRSERIPRAKPRIGLICACIYDVTKIPPIELGKIYGLKQKYITDGLKMFAHELLPFNNISIESLINELFIKINQLGTDTETELILISVRGIITEMVKLCNIYYIGFNTTLKTKCAGIIWYLKESKKIDINFDVLVKILSIGKNTIFKFYDQFLIILHAVSRKDGQYQENFANRREQILQYLKSRDIPVVKFVLRGKFLKFATTYNFAVN